MAKKSSSGHKKPTTAHGKGPAHKQQTPERVNSTATLVRSDGQPSPSAANVVADAAPVARPQVAPAPKAPAAKTAVAAKPIAKTAVAAKPAVRTPAARPAVSEAAPTKTPAATATAPAKASTSATATATAPAKAAAPRPTTSAREQSMRMARARATQRARADHLISAENYSYVVSDLKLVVALAVTFFGVLIALTFILPH